MRHRKHTRINLDSEVFNALQKKRSFSSCRTYDWEKHLPKEVYERNKWLGNVWGEIYLKNPRDEFIRFLSTDDMLYTKWFEKYGYKEPDFKNLK